MLWIPFAKSSVIAMTYRWWHVRTSTRRSASMLLLLLLLLLQTVDEIKLRRSGACSSTKRSRATRAHPRRSAPSCRCPSSTPTARPSATYCCNVIRNSVFQSAMPRAAPAVRTRAEHPPIVRSTARGTRNVRFRMGLLVMMSRRSRRRRLTTTPWQGRSKRCSTSLLLLRLLLLL